VALNGLIPAAMALLPAESRPVIRHQTGRKQVEATTANFEKAGVAAEVLPFIDDMASAYAWADLVICRSGALTVSELAAAGAASILIPYPFAVDDHQTANARYLTGAGAALLCPQKGLTPEALAQTLSSVWRRETLLAMAVKARGQARAEATATVASCCLDPRA
jgi:UDP-N-acetylglucosamine--N-acetylmuramyl-(pentapeptide) pyrophosphoryl-undecaprenol N-acetylglucosamine transferase